MHARRYSIGVLALVTAVVTGVGAFNYAVDPYQLWRRGGHVGYAGDELGRLTKAHWIDGYGADLVVLGNSHANGGFAASSFVDRGLAERPFNGALPAGQIYELRRYFQHYAELSELRSAVVIVDILNFMDIAPVGGAFDEDRLAVAPDGAPNPDWKMADLVFTNLTGAAIQASFKALTSGKRLKTVPDGFRTCTPKRTPQKLNRSVVYLGANYDRFRAGTFLDGAKNFDWRRELSALFDDAVRRGVRLYVVIPPAHVTYYMEIEAAGYWNAYTSIVAEAVKLAEKSGGDIEVYDFTGFGKVQTEPIRAGARSLYWRDTNHFSCHAGDQIVARLADQRTKPAAFGELVTSDTISAHLERIEAGKRDWIRRSGGEYCGYLKVMPEAVRDALKGDC